MSQENVEIIRRIYAAMDHLSIPSSVGTVSFPRERVEDLVDPDIEWRGPRDAEVQTHLTAHLWTLNGGRAARMQSYWERADALEAVGLSE